MLVFVLFRFVVTFVAWEHLGAAREPEPACALAVVLAAASVRKLGACYVPCFVGFGLEGELLQADCGITSEQTPSRGVGGVRLSPCVILRSLKSGM